MAATTLFSSPKSTVHASERTHRSSTSTAPITRSSSRQRSAISQIGPTPLSLASSRRSWEQQVPRWLGRRREDAPLQGAGRRAPEGDGGGGGGSRARRARRALVRGP